MARSDTTEITLLSTASVTQPYVVAQIIFSADSPSITSHPGIANLPGTKIEGVIQSVSSLSQQVWPEEGRTTIGALTIKLIDGGSPTNLTAELRDQLANNGEGIRDREVRMFVGHGLDFNVGYARVATGYVDSVEFSAGVYTIRCRDKSRALRDDIFDPKTARLGAELTDDPLVTTVTCDRDLNEQGFRLITTHAGWSDGPSGTYGWIRIKKTGEIIRYSGISGNSFTGCSRERFRTKAQAVEYDPDRPAEIEEFVYLEGPGLWAAKAVMTGVIDPTASPRTMLPDHWHLGLDYDSDLLNEQWDGIGEDLYDPADMTAGFPVRFMYQKKTDGKKWLEKEIYQLLGVYSPTTSHGQFGLRRLNKVISGAPVAVLSPTTVIKHSGLKHDAGAVRNQFEVNWNYDGEDFTRKLVVVDNQSVITHGTAKSIALNFQGLHTSRHTESAIINRIAVLRDRYAGPPLRIKAHLPFFYNYLEIGDLVSLSLPAVEDYADIAASSGMARTFEVQSTDIEWTTGEVALMLFASTRLQVSPTYAGDGPSLADAWYTSAGTDIASLPGYSGGTLTGGTLTGSANVNNAVWYHDGDLTLAGTITLTSNVQLRVRGFVTINGTLNGAGQGHAGKADTDTVNSTSTGWSKGVPTSGYLGPAIAGDGAWYFVSLGDIDFFANAPGSVTTYAHASSPSLVLTIDDDGNLTSKFPKDLRGSAGGAGAQVITGAVSTPGTGGTVKAVGGTGGNSGAGLVIVCRGLGFGLSGKIDLSGTDGTAGGKTTAVWDVVDTNGGMHFDFPFNAGAGAGGMPGALHIVLDGGTVPYPDINSTTFLAHRGETPLAGVLAQDIREKDSKRAWPWLAWPPSLEQWGPATSPDTEIGALSRNVTPARTNMWGAAYFAQYAPAAKSADEDVVPAPQNLTATNGTGNIGLKWRWPSGDVDFVEVFQSTVNDRAFAEEIAEVRGTAYTAPLPGGGTRYYWIRARGTDGRLSAWYPTGATSGVSGSASDAGIVMTVSASQSLSWLRDLSTSPPTYSPATLANIITCTVSQVGVPIATETVNVIVNSSTAKLSWVVTADHGDIEVASLPATDSPTITLTFTHTPSGIAQSVTLLVASSGEKGDAGRPGSRALAVRPNRDTFDTTLNGWLYLHGFDDLGNPADQRGEIVHNGAVLTIPKGSVQAEAAIGEGWIIYETAGGSPFGHYGTQKNAAAAVKTRAGWKYSDGSGVLSSFTATATMVAIGTISVSGGYVTSAAILGNALGLGSLPYEKAHEVYTDDIQPGALADLEAFASTLRPIAVVSSLPALPDTDYPAGAVVFLTSDGKLYRNVGGAWSRATDGADLTVGSIIADKIDTGAIEAGAIATGAVTAIKLESAMTLATLIKTLGSGNRVELEGNVAFPFWIGSGTKGTVSGTPGSGAKVYYDQSADLFGITGKLIASYIKADKDKPLYVEGTGGYTSALLGAVTGSASTALDTTYTTVWITAALLHPDNATGGDANAYRRLQHLGQQFLVMIAGTVDSDAAGAARTIDYACEVEYDTSGTWTTVFTVSHATVQWGSAGGLNIPFVTAPKSSGWTTQVRLRLRAKLASGSASDATIRSQYVILIPNMGLHGVPTYSLP